MTIASHGYDGTLDETDFSRLMKLVGRAPIVAGPTDLAVAGVAGSRVVTVAVGTAYGLGVQVDIAPAERVNVPAPNQGQFFLVVLRRDWSANQADPDVGPIVEGSSIQILPSDTTTTAVPTVPPAVLPLLKADPGLAADQPLAWVWASSTTTDVTVFDLRAFAADAERVATIPARDAIPAERLFVGKRVHVESTGRTYRRSSASWLLDGLNPCTSTTRPADPYLNLLIFETDTKRFGYWDGGAWVFPGASAAGITEGTVDSARLPDAVQRAAAEAGVDEQRLGRAALNASNQDMNGLLTSGFFRGSGMVNAPTSDWIYVLVIRHDDSYVRQVAFHFFGQGMWQRRKDGGNWQPWVYFPNAGDFDNGFLDNRYYREGEIDSFNQQIEGRRSDGDNWVIGLFDNGRIDWRSNNLANARIDERGLVRIGAVSVPNMLNNTPVNVAWPSGRFTAPPKVATGMYTATSVSTMYAGVANVTASGFTAYYGRSTNAAATVDFIGVQQ